MRNGNQKRGVVHFHMILLFLPYLWGMETLFSLELGDAILTVLTVPMRNGNDFHKRPLYMFPYRSYRTYEEWKLFWLETWGCKERTRFLPYLWGMDTLATAGVWRMHSVVLTVPMRNGNSRLQNIKQVTIMFLPYLWGMETFSKIISNVA